ncbi:sensor histidine kinase [Actinocorallia populi]|uniref:sensor histidine kinase n=1 Tax=Actinocorallia populi TaxID=2079200 RepID=UPI000D08E1AB|nr:sensor histidine kinase [Actinocorallia populi]
MTVKMVERLRRHPQVVDLLWTLPLLAYALFVMRAVPDPKVHLLVIFGLLTPLVWRRKWPRTVFAVVALVSFAQWMAGMHPQVANMAVMIALYTVATRSTLPWALAAAAVNVFGFSLATFDGELSLRDSLSAVATMTVFIGAFLVYGVYLRTRRAYLQSLEERALQSEHERDTQVRMAMAAERARIARELHDVIAHNVSVMVVQADGAAYAIDTDVDRAKNALETISATGRLALGEMRRLLGVLRESDDTGTYTPQPGVEQLDELVEQVRDAGLPLEFTVEGEPKELPQGLQLSVFRIVQEALTNTLKHAGPGARARVRLRYDNGGVGIHVQDDGRGNAMVENDGKGHGLAGMRERAALYGGTVRAEPVPGGGFEVDVRLPAGEAAR